MAMAEPMAPAPTIAMVASVRIMTAWRIVEIGSVVDPQA
jgi:hypothetical protein